MDFLEKRLLTLFRFLFVILTWVGLILTAGTAGYYGLQYVTASPGLVSEPSVEAGYVPPSESPVIREDRLKRLKDAKTSFESKMEDARKQIALSLRSGRSGLREIATRYDELSVLSENKTDPTKLTDLATARASETQQVCSEVNTRIGSALESIARDRDMIAATFNVAPEDIAASPVDDLRSDIALPEACAVYQDQVVAIAKSLRAAYPVNWGLSGPDAKADLERDISSIFEEVDRRTESAFANEVKAGFESYVKEVEAYYIDQRQQLESRNRFTSETVSILGTSITQDCRDYFTRAFDRYDKYEAALTTAEFLAAERVSTAKKVLGLLWLPALVLLGMLAYVAFLAIERHQRARKSLLESAE